jgi:concanavalin A-like lectin/glucanase superfamily protein
VATYSHSLESGQASGTAITSGNSSTGGTAFDTVSAGTGAAITYDGTALRETLSLLATVGATSTTAEADWTSTTITSGMAHVYGRFLVRPTTSGVAAVYLRPFGSGSQSFRITIDATNHITLRNNGSSLLVASTNAIGTSDTWMVRFDVTVGASATGVLYIHTNPLVATPDETLTANSANFGTNNINEARWGIVANATNAGVRLDDLVLTDVGLPGPPIVTITPSAVAAVAAVPAPTLDTGGTFVTPSAVAAVADVPAPVISTSSTVTPAAVAAAASVPSPTVTTSTPPAIVNQWTTTTTDADPIVRATPTAGNWLIVTTSWHTIDGTVPAIAVGDLARNYWRRLGQSNNTDQGIGVEIWACPNVSLGGRSYTDVHVTVADVTGSDLGRVAVDVAEISNLGDFITLEAVDAQTADSATAFSVSMPTPGAATLAIVGVVVDDDDTTISHTAVGWTALTQVSATSAVEIEQHGRIKATSAAESSTWTSSPAVNLAGVLVAVRQSGTAPAAATANWPGLQVQLGLGFDMNTPLPAVEWTSLLDRMASLRTKHGIQAELGAPQAGETDIDLRNNDGALTPRTAAGTATTAGPGTDVYGVIPDSQATHALGDFVVFKRAGIPVTTVTGDYAVRVVDKPSAFGFTNLTFTPALTVATATSDTVEACPLDMYLPVRALATWDGKTYPIYTGQVERLPQQTVDAHHVVVPAVGVDALATLTAETVTPLRGEILRRSPLMYWPCDDPSGSPAAQNISGRTSEQLTQQLSKFGPGSATAGFGGDTRSDGLHGINGDLGTGWEQTGLIAADTTEGYCLRADPDESVPLSTGITIYVCARINRLPTNPITHDPTIFIIKNSDPGGGGTGAMLQLSADQPNGEAKISVWDKDTHARTDTIHTQRIDFTTSWIDLAVTFTRTSWTCYLEGGVIDLGGSVFSGSCDLATSFSILSVFGEADQFFNGTMALGCVAHVAVWDRVLSAAEIAKITDIRANSGSGSEYAHQRIKRRLAISRWKGARVLSAADILLSDDAGFEGRSIADLVAEVASFEGGLAYVDAGGYLRFESRAIAADKVATVVLGEDTAGGEVPYQPGISYDFDPSFVYDHVEVTRTADVWDTDTPQGFANSKTVHVTEDSTSIGKYGLRTLSKDIRVYTLQDASALAAWLLSKYRVPQLRIQTVTIDPTAYPAAWPAVLGTDVGDLVTINRRPLGAPPTATECMVLAVQHEITTEPTRWRTTWTLAAADPSTLVLNDPVRGIVGDNGFGW